jgi:hypothetical protein
MSQTFKYKTFTSNTDFSKWQRSGDFNIFQMQPIMNTVELDPQSESKEKLEAQVSINLFVVYTEEVLEQPEGSNEKLN